MYSPTSTHDVWTNQNTHGSKRHAYCSAPVSIHWREAVKQQLDQDVNLGVIENVEPNTPSSWCHRANWTRKSDSSPRRVVDFQSLNKQCIRNTHHTSTIPAGENNTVQHLPISGMGITLFRSKAMIDTF